MSRDDMLQAIREATAAAQKAEGARVAAIRAAFYDGVNRDLIAEAAGISRDGVYKLMRVHGGNT
jgi:hypothetical protein